MLFVVQELLDKRRDHLKAQEPFAGVLISRLECETLSL